MHKVPEVFEWEHLLDRTDENPVAPINMITINMKKVKVQELKALFPKLGIALPTDKKKPSLFNEL